VSTNILELNGKQFDAVTGQFLGVVAKQPAKPHLHDKKEGQVLDSVVRHPAEAKAESLAPKPIDVKAQPKKPPARSINFADVHKPHHSKTLMRKAVVKPNISFKRHLKTVARTDILAKQPSFTITPRLSYTVVNTERLEHAKKIAKSRLISKFSPEFGLTKPVPKTKKPAAFHGHPTSYLQPVTTQPQTMDIFEQAIASATSHEQPEVSPKKLAKLNKVNRSHHGRRSVGFSSAILAVLVIVGFFGYQLKPALDVKLASARAGFHVALIGNLPKGYSFENVAYSSGSASVSYKSGNTGFTVAQKESNWDTQTLLNSYVAANDQTYKAYTDAGRTVYISGNQATWVDEGVWYTLYGNSNLSANQMVQMAETM